MFRAPNVDPHIRSPTPAHPRVLFSSEYDVRVCVGKTPINSFQADEFPARPETHRKVYAYVIICHRVAAWPVVPGSSVPFNAHFPRVARMFVDFRSALVLPVHKKLLWALWRR
jgi:hypothetical protein